MKPSLFPGLAPILMASLLACAICLPRAAQASITINSNSVRAEVNDSDTVYNSDYFYGTNIPTNTSVQADIPGGFFSHTDISYTESGGQTVLTHAFDQNRGGGYYDYAYSYDGSLYFTAGTNTTYVLSGRYSVDDVGNDSGEVFFHSLLYDQTSNSYLFENYQLSYSTTDESFTLGGTGGDYNNSLIGSLTGQLIAGHQYQWYSYALTNAYPDVDSGASARGYVSLTIGSVPEPATLFVWSLLGLTAGAISYQRRRREAIGAEA